MKVLVTGSTGMIGGHFLTACEKRGWETHGLSRSTSHSRQTLSVIKTIMNVIF